MINITTDQLIEKFPELKTWEGLLYAYEQIGELKGEIKIMKPEFLARQL